MSWIVNFTQLWDVLKIWKKDINVNTYNFTYIVPINTCSTDSERGLDALDYRLFNIVWNCDSLKVMTFLLTTPISRIRSSTVLFTILYMIMTLSSDDVVDDVGRPASFRNWGEPTSASKEWTTSDPTKQARSVIWRRVYACGWYWAIHYRLVLIHIWRSSAFAWLGHSFACFI